MIRIYQLPEKLTNGYCFGGGNPIEFLNVDWMDSPPPEMDMGRVEIEQFIRQKNYFKSDRRFLVLDDRPGETFILEPTP